MSKHECEVDERAPLRDRLGLYVGKRCKHCQAVPYRGWWIAAIEWDARRLESMRYVDRQIAITRRLAR